MATKTQRRKADKKRQEARDALNVCGAKKRNGLACGRQKGWGTDHLGSGRCKHHGGSSPSGKQAAAHDGLSMATPIGMTPTQGMGAVMRLTAGQLAFAASKVLELNHDGMGTRTDKKEGLFVQGYSPEGNAIGMIPHHWLKLMRELQNDLAKFSKMAADAGLAERAQIMNEKQTELMGKLVEDIMGDLDLNDSQRKALGPAIRERVMAMTIEGTAKEVA